MAVFESSVKRIVGPRSVRFEGPSNAERLEYIGLGNKGLNVLRCGSNWPDFTFKAGGNQIFETLAVMLGNPGAPYTHSPASGVNGVDLAPQFLGQSGTFSFPNGVSTLNFIDWPATIAIDNLVISKTPPTPIPEPCTLLLFATGLAGLSGLKRKARKV